MQFKTDPFNRSFYFLLVIVTSLMISCIGGGGGGDDPPAAPNDTGDSNVTTLHNVPPVADAGTDQTVFENQGVMLDGSNSHDSDSRIQSYQWKQVQGPIITLAGSNTAHLSFTSPAVNTDTSLTFELTVTDVTGLSASDQVSVSVINNNPPVAKAGDDQTVWEDHGVTLDGSASSDADGAISSYQWEQTAGPVAILSATDAASITFTAPTVSSDTSLSFELTVSDQQGVTATDTVTIFVQNNQIPVADAGVDQSAWSGQTVSLSGLNSQDPDGSIVQYFWTQLSGTSVTGDSGFDPNSPTLSFSAPNSHEELRFRLTVTDNLGESDTDEVDVSVSRILFQEDFSQGLDEFTWIKVDDSAGTGNQSYWEVSSGALLQSNYVASAAEENSFSQSYHRGSYRYLNTSTGLADYRFQVEITPLTNGYGVDGNDVGIMFRYQNVNNYYRLTMNSRYGFTRLEKKSGGQFSTLAVNSIGYIDDVPTEFMVDVIGDRIQVFIDNESVFSVTDADFSFGTVALYSQDRVRFDDVLISDPSLTPSVAISTPLSYMVATTSSSDLSVEAHVNNLPSGAWITFLLDDSVSRVISQAPFVTTFNGVTAGEHSLTAILKDSSGQELSRDTNLQAGTQGAYYIAVGDSITNGSGDSFSRDNASQDQRTVGLQGYQAGLNDKLTSYTNRPQIVFNEGIPGATTASSINTIDSIVQRHSDAETVLLLLGTNDANQGVAAADFQSNMQTIVNQITASGKAVHVAKILPQFKADTGQPNTTRNAVISEYNSRIEALDGALSGPDLYTYFINNTGLVTDSMHPNSLGHSCIAQLWCNSLTGQSIDPFILNNFQAPNLYQQNLLEEDDYFYIDESFTLEYVPPELADGIWIMTANADKNDSSSNYVSFNLDRSATVYVAYKGGAGISLPSWLSGSFTDSGLNINTAIGAFDVYRRSYGSGSVILGGNHAGGGNADYNYIAIVVD